MAQLAIDKDFLDDYSKLEKSVRVAVKAAMDKFAEHTHAGVHLEKIHKAKDERLRTIRIDQYWRGVVMAPDTGNTYYLLKVMPHDKALEYAACHLLSVNQALGVVEIRNQGALDEIQPALESAAQAASGAELLGHVSDADLTQLGIDDNTRTIARLLTSVAHLEALQTMIPEVQYIALYGLAAGQSPEEVWAEISQYALAEPELIDTRDIAKAMRRTPGKVVFVGGADELDRILKHPFALWRTFLHPAQRKIAYAPKYAGPVQVTGGAGTGKTVTALHRAAHLSKRALGQLDASSGQPAILITTFTRNLADALENQFGLLAEDDDIRGRVTISTVDSLASQVVARTRGSKPSPIYGSELSAVWEKVAESTGAFSGSFLSREWTQVILAQGLPSEQAYLTCSRAGQGMPLGKAQRREVWLLVQQAETELAALRRDTFVQLADEAARALSEPAAAKPYRHVIIDEAQDLHPAQWRLLRACVPAAPDDMFIVGDPHQRIYDNRVSLAKAGINVRGRSRRLTVNYRTTQEILALAVPALGRGPVTGLDDETDSLSGYRSPLHGRRPKVIRASSREAELAALVRHVRSWLDDGIEPHAIGVAARAGYLWKEAAAALEAAGIPTVSLSAKSSKTAVRVGTMHGMKGLEFQAVAVIGVSDGVVPAPNAVTPEAIDPLAHAQDLQRERCLLFVACTRARDHLYVSYNGTPSPFLLQG